MRAVPHRTSRRATACLTAAASAVALMACGEPAMLGEECVSTGNCAEGLTCIERRVSETETMPVCMADCDRAMSRLCPGGEVCVEVRGGGRDPMLGACSLGGPVALGDACMLSGECAAGGVCVSSDGFATPGTCRQACRVGDDGPCEGDDVCRDVGNGSAGVCDAPPQP